MLNFNTFNIMVVAIFQNSLSPCNVIACNIHLIFYPFTRHKSCLTFLGFESDGRKLEILFYSCCVFNFQLLVYSKNKS